MLADKWKERVRDMQSRTKSEREDKRRGERQKIR